MTMIYHFTNDTRFADLEENLYSVANYIENNVWENKTQTLSQAENGWYHVYTLYFGLYKGSSNIEAILKGKTQSVIAEFAKKFQFPNPRKVKRIDAMAEQIKIGQQIAPLRETIKLLFYKSLIEKDNQPKISTIEFKKYILSNEELGIENLSIAKVYESLTEKRLDSENVDYDYYGGDPKRFINQLLGIITKLNFIDLIRENNEEKIILNLVNLTSEDKENLLDIVSYNDYWSPISTENKESVRSYMQYMQLESRDGEQEIIPSGVKAQQEDDFYNVIYYGAPGTGKSKSISEKIKRYYPDFENQDCLDVFRTTLHPEYTYSDFVGQVMPIVDDERVTYEFSPGVFTLALKRALDVPDNRPIYLILEELSRANVAAVFGDLFQLLDRKNGQSEYKVSNPLIAKYIYNLTDQDVKNGESIKIYLPQNLYIYATVNTNDQNVFAMDTAFKRRFDWEYISANPVNSANNPTLQIYDEEYRYSIKWHDFYVTLNDYIMREMALSEDKQIGQFFIKFVESDVINKRIMKNKLLQYLWDDVEKATFNGQKLFNEDIKSFSELYISFEDNKQIFSVDFLNKMKAFISSYQLKTEDVAKLTEMEVQENEK